MLASLMSLSSLVEIYTQKESIDVETAIIPNEAQLLEFVHEESDPGACCPNHFSQCLLSYCDDYLLRLTLLVLAS